MNKMIEIEQTEFRFNQNVKSKMWKVKGEILDEMKIYFDCENRMTRFVKLKAQ
jgi:hypothetical protein